MNTALTERSYENNDNVYGAVTFRQADSDSGIYDYTVHVGRDDDRHNFRVVAYCDGHVELCCAGGGFFVARHPSTRLGMRGSGSPTDELMSQRGRRRWYATERAKLLPHVRVRG